MRYFIDFEFIEDGMTIDPISLGIASEDGRELYLQFSDCDFTKANDWVWRNVCPHLSHFDFQKRGRSCDKPRPDEFDYRGDRCKSGRKDSSCPWRTKREARELILEFCGNDAYCPEFWGYYCDYDWVAFCQLFGRMVNLPKGFPMYCRDIKQLADSFGNPRFNSPKKEHNALCDAKWNRDFYDFLTRSHPQ